MYIFKEGEPIIYKGDINASSANRRHPRHATVERIETERFPYVWIRLFPTNDLICVEARLIRSVHTKEEHLISLGFEKREISNGIFYVLNDITITFIMFEFPERHTYVMGYRIIPSAPLVLDLSPYLEQNKIDNDKFTADYPDMNNLNFLLNWLEQSGVVTPAVQDLVEISPYE